MFPDITCDECVDALVLAGHRVVRKTSEAVVLEKGLRTVLVPRKKPITEDLLETILVTANMPLSRFAKLLCEVPTRPNLICV